jgi:hypothetical protein
VFHTISDNNFATGNTYIDRGGIIYISSFINQENVVKYGMAPQPQIIVGILEILSTGSKRKENFDNQKRASSVRL